VAEALRKEPGTRVELVDGAKGEFTVAVDGRTAAEKGDSLPSVEDVLAAVRRSEATAAGS
jgi:hypothetical protein